MNVSHYIHWSKNLMNMLFWKFLFLFGVVTSINK